MSCTATSKPRRLRVVEVEALASAARSPRKAGDACARSYDALALTSHLAGLWRLEHDLASTRPAHQSAKPRALVCSVLAYTVI